MNREREYMKERNQTYKELALEFKQTKSEKAYNKLYHKMYNGLRAFVFGILKDEDMTDDVVTNTMTKIYTRIDEYDEQFQITTWAYTIAKNEALVTLKRNSRLSSIEHLHETVGFDIPDDYDIEELKTEDDLFEEENIIQEQMKKIKAEVLKLPKIYKDYLYPRIYENAKYNDILEKMKKVEPGISLCTVKNRIHHGKERVRKNLINDPLFKNFNIECI